MTPGRFFSYDLPPDRIAQRSKGFSDCRSDALLLHAQANGNEVKLVDRKVNELSQLLRPGDQLVLNNSKVIPARFFFMHGETRAEVLLLAEEEEHSVWRALARPMRRLREGEILPLSQNLRAQVLGRTESGDELRLRIVTESQASVMSLITKEGNMPIPGYIRSGISDETDLMLYQNVFAKTPGSVAAPTAGLHFTEELLAELRSAGVEICELTLHVGPASFQPVRDPKHHEMPTEWFSVEPTVLAALKKGKAEGRRIVCVGTTSARTLESVWETPIEDAQFRSTKLFITPGFTFRAVDVLMTNFHQPKTSHLLLVAAFIGEENTERIYEHALCGKYRFLSYGDSMLLERGR